MHSTPATLMERLRTPGDSEAWERFVQLYTPLLYSWANGVGLRADDAADLVQEVFAQLVTKLPEFQYDRSKSFRAWLRQVTLNKWRELLRKAPPRGVAGAPLDQFPAPNQAEALWDREYRRHVANRALALMQRDFEPTTWQACWQHVVSGKPAAEVAADLGLTVGAVYAAKFRVLSRLRQELEGLLD